MSIQKIIRVFGKSDSCKSTAIYNAMMKYLEVDTPGILFLYKKDITTNIYIRSENTQMISVCFAMAGDNEKLVEDNIAFACTRGCDILVGARNTDDEPKGQKFWDDAQKKYHIDKVPIEEIPTNGIVNIVNVVNEICSKLHL